MSEESHSHTNYVKIWAILLVLLFVSVLGPLVGNFYITLITAFGIAIVKALMVCAYFMHLKTEKRIVWYMLLASVALMVLFFSALMPDIMRSEGDNWEKTVVLKAKPVLGHGNHDGNTLKHAEHGSHAGDHH